MTGDDRLRQWLKNIRESKGISQQNVAEKVGITRQYYQLIEAGERQQKMDITLIAKLSQVLGVSMNQIIDNEMQQVKKGQ
jgi:transcriptional regulator with XRE-family HTH domain